MRHPRTERKNRILAMICVTALLLISLDPASTFAQETAGSVSGSDAAEGCVSDGLETVGTVSGSDAAGTEASVLPAGEESEIGRLAAPAVQAGEVKIVVEAESYTPGGGDVWAAENDFSGNGWNSGDWSGGRGIRFGSWGYCSYSFSVAETGSYQVKGFAASRSGNFGYIRFNIDSTDGWLYVPDNCSAPTEVPLLSARDNSKESGTIELSQGNHTIWCTVENVDGDAKWCYFDRFELTRIPDSPVVPEQPDEPETPFTEAEAEDCTYTNLGSGNGDGNFTQVSGGYALRNQGGEGTITGRVLLGEAGKYDVRVYAGSRAGNEGMDKIVIDGTEYSLYIPEGTAPEWSAVRLRDPATGNPVGMQEFSAGEHTFQITSRAAWCYYDRIVFHPESSAPPAQEAEPELTLYAARGVPAELRYFALAAKELFADPISDEAVLRLTGENTFTYRLRVPEAGLYEIKAKTAAKDNSGAASLTVNGVSYPVNVAASGKSEGLPLMEAAVASRVELPAGEITVTLSTGTAVWCYFDSFLFSRQQDEPEQPDEPETPFTEAEAEDCTYTNLGSGIGDGNFTQVSGGYALRNQGGEGTITGRVLLGEAGKYDVRVYAGSRAGNEGMDKIVIDGMEYSLYIPEGTAPEWYAVRLRDPATGNPVGMQEFSAGEHTFQITSRAAWCYYDRIVFHPESTAPPAQSAEPELTLYAARGVPAELRDFAFAAKELFADPISDEAVLRLTGKNTFTYRLRVPETGYYRITARTAAKSSDGGAAVLTVNGVKYSIHVTGSGLDSKLPLREEEVARQIPLPAGEITVTLSTGTADWCYFDSFRLAREETDAPPENPIRELTAEIDGLPSPEKITTEYSAELERILRLTEEFQTLAERYGWEDLDEARQGKLLLCRARLASLQVSPRSLAGQYFYEWEDGIPGGNTALAGQGSAMSGASGGSYVYLFDGTMTLHFYAPEAGRYQMFFWSAVDGGGDNPKEQAKYDICVLNGEPGFLYTPAGHPGEWQVSQLGRERYLNGTPAPQYPAKGHWLNKGWNTIILQAKWGYACYDGFSIQPAGAESYYGWYSPEDLNDMIRDMPDWQEVKAEEYELIGRVYRGYGSLYEDEKVYIKEKDREKLFLAQARADALLQLGDASPGMFWYELENGTLHGNTSVGKDYYTYEGYTGAGYVYLFDKSMSCEVYVPADGTYDIYLRASSEPGGDKCDFVQVNGTDYLVSIPAGEREWKLAPVGDEAYENGKINVTLPVGGIPLKAGKNTLTIRANWGYCAYDAVVLVPGTGRSPDEEANDSAVSARTREAGVQMPKVGPGWVSEESKKDWKPMGKGKTVMRNGRTDGGSKSGTGETRGEKAQDGSKGGS